MKNKIILIGTLFLSVISFSQTIEKFSIDSGGASASAGGIQMLYTIGEVNVQEYSNATLSVSEGFINAQFRIKIDPKLFLQGPLLNPITSGLMNDDLRALSYIPTTSPYADGLTIEPDVLNTGGASGTGTQANDIVDWVWVELRNSTDNTQIVRGQSALVQRDGDVVARDGISELTMSAQPKNYFVVVKHRNHLGVMSQTTIALSETPTTVDFTDNVFTTLDVNGRVLLASGDMALWAGDVNGNASVRYLGGGNDTNTIKDNVLNNLGNTTNNNLFPYSGYDNADINMNSVTRYLGSGNDTNLLKDIILSHPSNTGNSNLFIIVGEVQN